MDAGILPWWTVPDYRLAFSRYLSAISMWLDYRLWPDSPVLMHAHSLLWLGAMVAAAAALYRRVLGASWTAGLAALLYALDEAHAMPAAWAGLYERAPWRPDPSLRWIVWSGRRFVPFTPPKVGGSVRVPAPPSAVDLLTDEE